jgi:hypothetical protein
MQHAVEQVLGAKTGGRFGLGMAGMGKVLTTESICIPLYCSVPVI